MAKRAVKRERKAVDPMFAIPEGVEELYYDEAKAVDDFEEEFLSADEAGFADNTDYSDQPETPQILSVVDQIVRQDAAGNEVVDLIVEVEEIVGAEDYEFHVTKI